MLTFYQDKQQYNIIQLSAGTPAMNFSLSHLLMNKPGALFYYIPDKPNKDVYEDKMFNELNIKNHLITIKELITHYDYNGALKVVKNSPFKNNQVLIKILSFLNNRKNFNVNEETLNKEARYISAQAHTFFPDIFNHARKLLDNDIQYTFTEFYYQIQLYFNIHNFVGAIALIFSFFDNLMQYLIEQYLGIKLDDVNRGKSENLKNAIEKIPALDKKMEKKKLNKSNPSGVVFKKTISHFRNEDRDGVADIFYQNYKKFERFQDIRNKGPFGHGTKGLSQEYIEEKYGDTIQNILKNLAYLLCEMDLLKDEFSYDSYNRQIIDYMGKEAGTNLN